MKKHMLFVWCLTLMVIATLVPKQLRAQAAAQAGQHFAVHVEGLTNEDRDAVQKQLHGRQDLKLVFACVPAGIMVFEADA
ncbi:MAG TPA: hypothetical protein PK760_09290, partial [Flavobacteriales bacterium]|nr:hypothetical protein [Flavobacteriales bacterium]